MTYAVRDGAIFVATGLRNFRSRHPTPVLRGPFGLDDEGGCPLIGFEGRFRMRPLAELSYPDPESFLPGALTTDGNPV